MNPNICENDLLELLFFLECRDPTIELEREVRASLEPEEPEDSEYAYWFTLATFYAEI